VLCCTVLCCTLQAMVFAVTMNSKRNALLALMIATNFVELKGQVYKRTDTNKLWALACQVSVVMLNRGQEECACYNVTC
jgi:hypothetical protein